MHPRRYAALLSLLLLTACTSSSPDEPAGPDLPSEADFAQGACAPVAADVIGVGAALPRLGEGGVVDQAVKAELKQVQDRIFVFADAAPAQVKPALDDLVASIGAVRIRADGNSYETSLGDVLQTSYDAAVTACQAPAASQAPVVEVTLPPDLTVAPGETPSPSAPVAPPAPSPSG